MSKKNVKAFTILELTITMMISAILITLTFIIYGIVSRSYQSYSKKNDEVLVMLTLDKLLKRDFSRAERIERKDSTIWIINRIDTARYAFGAGFIVRTRGIIDTFRVNHQQLETKFEGQVPQVNPDSVIFQDELYFAIYYHDQVIPFHYYKQYSSENLFQNDANAIYRP